MRSLKSTANGFIARKRDSCKAKKGLTTAIAEAHAAEKAGRVLRERDSEVKSQIQREVSAQRGLLVPHRVRRGR